MPTVPVLGIKRECGAGKSPNSAAARNCKRRSHRHWPLGISVLGRRRRVVTREPGDLPSAVVTREDVGRGVRALASLGSRKRDGGSLVRCDVPLTSYRGLNHVFHHRHAAAPLLASASSFLVPIVSLGISAAQAQQGTGRAITADRSHLAHRPEPDPRKTDLRRTIDLAPRGASHISDAAHRCCVGTRPGTNSFSTGVGAVRQFNGIVGTSTAVITAQDMARSPAYTVQEIIAQTPGRTTDEPVWRR